jgi:SAM-dependent methyltransferase
VLLVGMDTPQLTPGLLDQSWRGADAVLGLSEDGGFWAIGLRSADPHAVFDGIPMSSERTGAAQLARLSGLGLTVELLPPLRDVDLPVDAEAVADAYPKLEFSRCYAELAARRGRQPVDRLFDQLYGGRTVTSRSAAGFGGDCFLAGRDRWLQPADPVDAMVVSRCEPPVIDIGCGPGRMVTALQRAGRPALGIDISKTAVALGAGRGGQILRRRLDDPLPAEGRWGTALLLDGNIGIGGDIAQLLTRCRDLVGAGGLIICEIQTDPDCAEQYDIVLSGGDQASHPLAWASAGLHTVQRVAAELDLIIAEEWRAGGRAFVSMRAGA